MSWPTWSASGAPIPTPMAATVQPALMPTAINSAPAVIAPVGYTQEQWAQAQQQNWQQWAQWQQQYQQWHQQYGAEYQKLTMQGAAPLPGVPTAQPPLPSNMAPTVAPPLPAENKPPLPPDDPPQPPQSAMPYGNAAQMNRISGGYTTAPAPLMAQSVAAPTQPTQAAYPNWQTGPQKRPLAREADYDQAKRTMLDKPANQWNQRPPPNQNQWQGNNQNYSQPPPRAAAPAPDKGNVEELSEAEKKFDKEFAAWEAQFNKWKEQNANHPDKTQYKEYEKKWESWRNSLLERREQMRRKRLAQTGQSATQKPPSAQPPLPANTPAVAPNKTPLLGQYPAASVPPQVNDLYSKPPPTQNNEPLSFKPAATAVPQDINEEGSGEGFLKSSATSGGIPGLDLVKEDSQDDENLPDRSNEMEEIDNQGDKPPESKGPDFEAISKGINSILGDQKLLSMLSMVSQNPASSTVVPSATNTTSAMPSQYQQNFALPPPGVQAYPGNYNTPAPEQPPFNPVQPNEQDYYQARGANNFDNQLNRFNAPPPGNNFNRDGVNNFGPRGMQDNFNARPIGGDNFNARPIGGDNFNARPIGGDNFNARPIGGDNFNARPIGGDKFNARPIGGDNFNARPIGGDNFNARPLVGDNFNARPPVGDKAPGNFNRPGGGDRKFDGGFRNDSFRNDNKDNFGGPKGNMGGNNFNRQRKDSFGASARKNSFNDDYDDYDNYNKEEDYDNYNEEEDYDKYNEMFRDDDDQHKDDFQGRGNDFKGRGPDFQDRDPDFQGRGPGFQGRRPDFQGRGPEFQGRGPDFQGRGPDFRGRGPDFKGRGPDFQDRDPDFQGRGTDFQGRGPDFKGRGPDFQGRGPDFQGRGPDIQGRRPDFQGRGPGFEDREPDFQDRGPGFETSPKKIPGLMDMVAPAPPAINPPIMEPIVEPPIESEEFFEPVTSIDYDHKSRTTPDKDKEVTVEPANMFDYRHTPLNRVALPERPKWLAESVKFIREFDPNLVRFEKPSTDRSEGRDRPFEGRDRPFEGRDRPFEGRDRPFEGRDRQFEGRDRPFEGRDRPFEGRDRPFEGRDRQFEGRDRQFEGRDRQFEGRDRPEGRDRQFEGRDRRFEGRNRPFEGRDRFEGTDNSFSRRDKKDMETGGRREKSFERDNDRKRNSRERTRERDDDVDDRFTKNTDKPRKEGGKGFEKPDFEEFSDNEMDFEHSEQVRHNTQEFETRKSRSKSPELLSNPPNPIIQTEIAMIEDIVNAPGRLNRPPRIVIILRGPPGSGKTFLAKQIKDKEVENGGSAPRILSLDDYFMVEQESKVMEDGKMQTVKKMVYEYEAEMEESYRASFMKSFKKTINDGYFPFIIVDNVNDKVKHFGEMWSYAKQNGFQVYICQLDLDPVMCSKRNIHNRSEKEIEDIISGWEPTPAHHPTIDASGFLQISATAIADVEMEVEDEDDQQEKAETAKPAAEAEDQVRSKWDAFDCSSNNLAKLDGVSRPPRKSRTMEEYLQLENQWEPPKSSTPGKKRVRWADLVEQRELEKMRAIGFVVGQTDWDRMMDPTGGSRALTQTKYIEKVSRYNN